MPHLHEGILTRQKVDETLAYSLAGVSTRENLPFDKDLIALVMDFTMQVDSGSAVTKGRDNPSGIIDELTVLGDGSPIINLTNEEILWYHLVMWGQFPDLRETPTATSQANQAAWMRPVIPIGARRLGLEKPQFKNLSLTVEWADVLASLDAGASFVVDSATLDLTALKGKGNMSFFTRRHTDTVNGRGEQDVPDGRLEAIILQTDGRDDNIDEIELVHNGDFIIRDDFEGVRAEMVRLYDMEPFYGPLVTADGDHKPGIVVIPGQQLVSAKGNMQLKYRTTASDTLNILYIFSA